MTLNQLITELQLLRASLLGDAPVMTEVSGNQAQIDSIVVRIEQDVQTVVLTEA